MNETVGMLSRVKDWLFDPSGLTPHGFCLLWEPGLIWTYALSDTGIAFAYFTIPVALAVFARRRADLVFRPIFWLFAAFILLCGATHWLDVLTLWVPAYGVEAAVKVLTALVSLATAVVLWRLLPHALALPSASQLREVNAALAKSEARHRANYEHSPVPLYTVNGHDIITSVSESFLSLLGYTHAEVVGRHISDLRTADSPSLTDEQRAALMRDGEVLDQERRFRKRDGSVVEALASARLDAKSDDGPDATSLICVLIDVTARRRAEAALRASEERLLQSQKMEAIGQLTGGIAHDFNNMLQGIGSCLERVDHMLVSHRLDEIPRYVGAAQQSVDRAATLTQRMLAFARRQSLQPRAVELDEMMRGMGELIQRAMGPAIDFRLRLHNGSWSARCDANQLESALLNLAINARDAMPEGGTLTISTTDRLLSLDDLADQPDAVPGDYVEVAVVDTGIGIAPDLVSRVFEPFFTTKPIGQGTGLGLSQVYGFVSQSGGFIRLESRLGFGTTVRLYIPRDETSEPPPPPPPVSAAPDEMPGEATGRSVLLVDDEAGVRALIAEALHDLGCLVLEADNGQTALRMIQSPTAIDLLVTDIGLPGMNGRQLAEAARAARPGMPVLLISGYTWSAAGPADVPAFGQAIETLQKPFNLELLGNRVRRLLNRHADADAMNRGNNSP